MLLGHSCFRSRRNPRPAAWTHANATRSAGAKPSFAAKPGRRSDRRKPGACGHAAANPDPQPNGPPSLLGINSGAALAMALTSALESDAGCRLFPVVHRGMRGRRELAAGHDRRRRVSRHTQDRNKLILAGIALSAFCMALTRITLLLAGRSCLRHLYWLAGGVSHAHWQDVWQLLPVVVTAVPVVLLLANQLNLLNVSDSTAHTLGVNLPRLRLIINMLVLLLVGACVSVAGPVAFIGLLVPHLARFWAGFDQRNVLPVSMLLGATLMLMADVLARALAFPAICPQAQCWR